MGRISTGVGLISGINSKDIIDQLMSIESRPVTQLQSRIDKNTQQKLAFTSLQTNLASLLLSAQTLQKSATFQQRTANSSDQSVLTASATTNAARGSYQFQVARLVTAQQAVSAGMADTTTAKVGAGTITVEMGGGEVSSQTLLSQLNGGAGVRRGSFRITDGSGRSQVVDIGTAFSLDDVVKKINTSLDITVKAEVQGDHLVLTDLSGQSNTALSVADIGGAHAAADLGIASAATGATLTGSNINFVGRLTSTSVLNDGRGVRIVKGSPDFNITDSQGGSYDIGLDGSNTVGAVLDAINSATAGNVIASVSADGKGITLTDSAGGAGALQVTSLNGSLAAKDLGIQQTASGQTITGTPVLASIDTVLLSSLRGGSGLNLGQISITDRTGAQAVIDLTGATSVQDVLDLINNNGSAAVTASLKQSGNGIQITDNSGGSGDLTINDVDSTTASELGIAGSFNAATAVVNGANLQRQWVSENTLLSDYNGGRGVALGQFSITNSLGLSTTIDLVQAKSNSIGDVINAINAKNIGVTASINANGDGLLLTDTAGGASALKVTDISGKTASDLNIASAGTGATIDGSFEKTFAVDATDTLSSVLDKINGPGFGVSASILNDGSGAAPYRLSLTARNTGIDGRFVFDAGTTNLQTSNLLEAQDAAVFYGSPNSAQPLVITSSSNQITNVIQGVTIDLQGVSTGPVTVNVTDNVDSAVSELTKFSQTFNDLVDKIASQTTYDSSTNTAGLLLGDSTTQTIQAELYTMVQTVVKGTGAYSSLFDLGVSVGDGAKLTVDEDKFRAAYAADPTSVQKLFTLFAQTPGSTVVDQKGLAAQIADHINRLIDPVTGVLTRENAALDVQAQDFQNRIDQLNSLLDTKRSRLETQFANLESVLAGLQSQQQALASFTSVAPLTSTKSSSSSK